MWMPTVTVPEPRPWTDSASSISVVCESSIENASTPTASGSASSAISGACSGGKPVPLGKLSKRKRFQWNS